MDIDFMLHTVMIYCQVCSRSVQRHSKQVKCSSCCLILHLKCITLSTDEQNCILNDASSWMCPSCTQTIFPFNWIEEDEIFSKEVCGRMNCVDINDLFVDEKKYSMYSMYLMIMKTTLLMTLTQIKIILIDMILNSQKVASTTMKINSIGSMLK